MHEFSVVEALLNIIFERAEKEGIRKVSRVHLRIGEYSGVFPDSLSFAFEVLSQGKITEGAELSIERVFPLRQCEICNSVVAMEVELCTQCGNEKIRMVGGDELEIAYFEGDKE